MPQGQQAERLIAQYGIRIINMSGNKGHDTMNHGKFVGLLRTFTELYAVEGASTDADPLSEAGMFAMNATGIILQTRTRIGESTPSR